MNESRGPWYLLTGVAVGLVLGLLYAWLIDPVAYIDTAPDTLRPEFKDHYRSLIALAYQSNPDVGRARSRLALLGDERPAFELGAQAQRVLAQGGSQQEARALAQLAAAMGELPHSTDEQTNSPSDSPSGGNTSPDDDALPSATPDPHLAVLTATLPPAPTATPMATFTPRAGLIQPTPGVAFVLRGQEQVCEEDVPAGLLQVEVVDHNRQPLPAVRVDLAWNEGQEFFFTGLHPRRSLGYADFRMTPGVVYSLRVGEGGEQVNEIAVPQCETADGFNNGGWKLVFSEP